MARWQKPFHHIPVDDHLNDPEVKKHLGYKDDHVHKLNNGIGPHERRTLGLMIAGIKPVVLLDEIEFKLTAWQEAIRDHQWGFYSLSYVTRFDELVIEYVVYLPDQEWRARKLLKQLIKGHPNKNSIM